MLDHLDARLLTGLGESGRDIGVVEAGKVELERLGSFVVVGAAQLLQVDVGHGPGQREDGVRGIEARAQTAHFLAEHGHEDDGAPGFFLERGQGVGNRDHRRRAAGVVIRAVENVVSLAGAAHAEVVVMRGDDDIFSLQLRVCTAQYADHVA